MKILFTSYVFSPSIGGIETVSALLVPEFVRAGHEVRLVTCTREDDGIERPFEVIRNPSPAELLRLTRWCDIFFQNNVSLDLAWPLLLVRRPWVIAHHILTDYSNRPGWKARLKNFLFRFARNTTVSNAMAEALSVPADVTGNPYDFETFRLWPEIPRQRDLIFVGRLLADKGADVLLGALAELMRRGLRPTLTIIGTGPEQEALKDLASRLGVRDQIDFAGGKKGPELAQVLNAHRIMVIPSRCTESFGVVALEGMACGCGMVASDIGGLPEAVGLCGLLVESGNCIALADGLQMALTEPEFRERQQLRAAGHLARFTPSVVAGCYLRIFAEELGKK